MFKKLLIFFLSLEITHIYFFKSLLQNTGMTPLMYATKDNKTSIMDRMIELGADVGARNNVSILKFCIRDSFNNSFFLLTKKKKKKTLSPL